MQTLSYGYKLPESGDKGSTLWTALEGDITRLNGHSHDGTDSTKLSAISVLATKQTIAHASWAAYSGPAGHYRQAVTMAAGYTFDENTIDFRDLNGCKVYPTVEKIDNTSFYIYTIDNTMDFLAVYGI